MKKNATLSEIQNLSFNGNVDISMRLYLRKFRDDFHFYLIPAGVPMTQFKNYEISKDFALYILKDTK